MITKEPINKMVGLKRPAAAPVNLLATVPTEKSLLLEKPNDILGQQVRG